MIHTLSMYGPWTNNIFYTYCMIPVRKQQPKHQKLNTYDIELKLISTLIQ